MRQCGEGKFSLQLLSEEEEEEEEEEEALFPLLPSSGS
tara:strand:+ start:158 stop:271 length:114 start_codon:yes stop_codon:yes gene_type:complete